MTKGRREILEELSIVFDKEKLDGYSAWIIQDGIFSYKNADLVFAYYQNLKEDKEKTIMISIIKDKLFDSYLSALAFVILHYLGYTDNTLNSYVDHLNIMCEHEYECDHEWSTLIWLLGDLLEQEIIRFDNNQLGKIKYILETYKHESTTKESLEKLISLRFKHFEKTLQGINTEINSDKKAVEEYLKQFGFENKYNLTLNKLDQYIQSEQGEGEVIPGGVVGILREFFKSFYIDLAKKIAAHNKLDNIPLNKDSETEIGHARRYIQQEFGLSSDEFKLLDAYKDICNNSGSHALLSEKKYLRLARNIGIEISLFMLEKFNDYITPKDLF